MNCIALVWLSGALALPSASQYEGRKDNPAVDAIKAIASMPTLVLTAATKDLPILKCLTTDRTAFNASAGTATYTWHIRGRNGQPGRDLPIDYVITDSPDKGVSYINSDTSNPIPAEAVYSDYKKCLIDIMFFGSGEWCFQWVTPGTENDIPEECSTAMKEQCPGAIDLYSDELCK
uniref:Lipocalin/cytosolic fatty-acid binding domain-containing protein n=1 Tax=Amblyomma maculatum TaxID=34609 RepID=G3MQH2_AMBMU